jgi:hypothetical protein
MRFNEDTPVFTGMAFAKGTMATSVAEYRNKAKQGFHYVGEFPVDTSEDFDGQEDMPEGYSEVSVVMVHDTKEELVHSVHGDPHAASLVIEAKSALKPGWKYRVIPTKVHYGYPPEMGDAGNLAVL